MNKTCASTLSVRRLGLQPFEPVWQRMRAFTDARDEATRDELWLLEHPPVFTLGQAGREEHLLAPGDVPVIKTDRGGQVTYHGPGQVVGYLMLDLARLGIGIRALVTGIESAVIAYLAERGVTAQTRKGAPGVYVDGAKVAALGLRVRRYRSYHGLSLNVDMDTEPFGRINPCGIEGLRVTSLRELGIDESIAEVGDALASRLASQFGYDELNEALESSHG